jgi:hypothetical protein
MNKIIFARLGKKLSPSNIYVLINVHHTLGSAEPSISTVESVFRNEDCMNI